MYIVNKINEGNRGKKYVMSKEKNYEKEIAVNMFGVHIVRGPVSLRESRCTGISF